MDVRQKRAIVAGLNPGADGLEPVLAEFGYALAGRATDGAAALRLIISLRPDLVIADAILPGIDGVALAGRARQLKLDVQPDILLLRPAGLRLPSEDRLATFGASVADKPLTPERLREALSRSSAETRALPPEKSVRLGGLLDALGLPEHPGREYLARAIALVWADRRRLRALKDGLYPEVALQTGKSSAQVERAIRHVIDVAWRTGEIEQQHRIFGDTIDAKRGKPTCGEMIAQLADILRWEG